MPTERFVQLMLKGLYYGFEEMWISEQPYLLFTYVSVYAPWIGRQINKFVGPKRVQALTSGENIFNMKVSYLLIYLLLLFLIIPILNFFNCFRSCSQNKQI